jgi:hypothetical protein
VVEIIDGVRTERITADTIDSLAAADPGSARLCALTRWSLTCDDEMRMRLAERTAAAPKWDETVLGASDVAVLRGRFAAGERLAFRVPLLVKRKKARPAASWFDVYLEHDDALRKPEHHFIRSLITIPDVRVNGERAARALIVIEDPALSRFLGDAENPAHSDWSERADKIRTQYEHGASTLRFVKNSASFLASLLGRPPEGRDRDFLRDLFSIDAPEASAPAGSVNTRIPIRAGSGESGAGAATPGGAATAAVTIGRIAGGFTIRGNAAVAGRPLRGEVAYRVRAGNPFRKHSPFDFDLLAGDAIATECDGARLRPTGVNAFELVPGAAKFQISMKGFDPRRDLVVRVVDAGDASETELH